MRPKSKLLAKFTGPKTLSLVGNLLTAALGTLTFAFLARGLSRGDFGIFTFFLSVFTLIDMLRNGLLGRPLVKFMAESRSNPAEQKELAGTAWQFGSVVSAVLGLAGSLVFGLLYWLEAGPEFAEYGLFFLPLLLLSLPFNLATWRLNARMQFGRLLWLRLTQQALQAAGATWFLLHGGTARDALLLLLLAFGAASLLSVLANWDDWRSWSKGTIASRKRLWSFGRFSMGTLIGGNLLRSSDTILIRAFLGAEAVAIYQVPLRLVNLVEIPLRALVTFYYPLLAQVRKDPQRDFQREFDKSNGFTFLFLLPFALATFFFAEPLCVLFGGEDYRGAANILRFFAVFMAISSLDRFAGNALDLFNRPKVNMVKVFLMLAVNIVGDLLVIWLVPDLQWIAFVSIFTFSAGVVYGYAQVRDVLHFRPLATLNGGFYELKRIVKKLVSK